MIWLMSNWPVAFVFAHNVMSRCIYDTENDDSLRLASVGSLLVMSLFSCEAAIRSSIRLSVY